MKENIRYRYRYIKSVSALLRLYLWLFVHEDSCDVVIQNAGVIVKMKYKLRKDCIYITGTNAILHEGALKHFLTIVTDMLKEVQEPPATGPVPDVEEQEKKVVVPASEARH